MKDKLLIIFKTVHGYTKRYVDILGNALGCDAVPVEKFRIGMASGYDKLLYIGSVRGSQVTGFNKISDYLDELYTRLAVCGVGLLPFRPEIPARLREGTISVSHETDVPMFYVQGGFDLNELSKTEKMNIAMIVRRIKASNLISEEDTLFLNAAQTPIDCVSQKHIQPLIDYYDGKPVDESLYCPPSKADEADGGESAESVDTVSDPAADAEKEAKKRELKKKLKK